MYYWILLGALCACLVAIGFFVVTIFSLQDMLEAQRKTEDRLRVSEEWLRAVVNNTKTLISVKNPDGRYVMLNRGFEHLLGVPALLAHGRSDAELFTPDLAAALCTNDSRVLAANESIEFDQAVPIGNGKTERRLFCVKTPLHDVVGNITGICTLASDLTDRELASKERHRIFELSLDMMSAASFEGYMTLVNPEFERVTGFTSQELCAMAGLDLVHPDDRADAVAALHLLHEGHPLVDYESRILCKDGSYKLCRWRAMPAVEEGMIYGVGREVRNDDVRHASAGEDRNDSQAPGPRRILRAAR
jgi:PAS domain S-box-containing protein